MRDQKSHRAKPSHAPRGREKGTISIQFVRPVVDAVRLRGLDPETVLREAGISPELLQISQARVSPQHYSALWRRVIHYLDDEFFAQDSRRMKSGSFALLTRAVVHCTNLQGALDRTARFLGAFLDDYAIGIGTSSELARITVEPRSAAGAQAVFANETLLVMVYGLACWLVGRRIPILHARFAYQRPAHASEYPALFGDSLAFDQPCTQLELDAAMLRLPVVQNERAAKEFLRVAPENILLRYNNTQSLSARIRRRLRQSSPDDWPDLETLAQELNTAPATLRRRLRADGESYQSIKDGLRRDLAITFLSDTALSVAAIALALGFHEPSAFHRAFRKWTHTSPGAYRRADQHGSVVPGATPRGT